MSSWDYAFERAQELNTRMDAFFERREADQRRKDAKRAAKRDGEPYAPPERGELRTGALSKAE
jgi:hypothetical protein